MLAPNAAGYDEDRRAAGVVRLLETLDALLTWDADRCPPPPQPVPAPATEREFVTAEMAAVEARLDSLREQARALRREYRDGVERGGVERGGVERGGGSAWEPKEARQAVLDLRNEYQLLHPGAEKLAAAVSAEIEHASHDESDPAERLTRLQYRVLLPRFEAALLATADTLDRLAEHLGVTDVKPLRGRAVWDGRWAA